MERSFKHTIITVAVSAAVICAALAWSAARRARRMEHENEILHRQLIELQTERDSFAADNSEADDVFAPLSGELAVLNELLDEPATTLEAAADEPKLTYTEKLEQMRAEDPELYEKFIEKTENRQQKLKYHLAERTALFVDLDTSQMTDRERESHDRLVERMTEIWELMGRMKHPSESDNRELLREMTGRMRRIEPLLRKERNTMIRLMAHDLGYDKQGAREFTERIQSIHEYTTLNSAGIRKM
jgi:hypothetical protein